MNLEVTLQGVNDDVIPLLSPTSNKSGVGLAEWPEAFDGIAQEHLWDEVSGVWRGVAPPGVTQFRLDLVLKGQPVEHFGRLKAALGDGTQDVHIWVRHAVSRSLRCRVRQVGKVAWHGSPASSHLAKMPIIVETAHPWWSGIPQRLELTQAPGLVALPTDGDQPVWPKITISGSHSILELRLTAEDKVQILPARSTGWVVETHPSRRQVLTGAGEIYAGAVPFWPNPASGELYLSGTVGPDFKAIIEYVPEASSIW